MPDAAWKAFERWVAAQLGGKRRGPDVRNVEEGGGNSDIILEGWSIECKKYARPTWGMINDAVKQAQDAKEGEGDMPIAVIGQKNRDRDKSLVVMGWGDFKKLFEALELISESLPLLRQYTAEAMACIPEEERNRILNTPELQALIAGPAPDPHK